MKIPCLPAAIYFFGVLTVSCSQTSDKGSSRPNVLFISIDDLNDWAQPLGGNNQAITPNLVSFGTQSVNFTNNYCTSPGCNPSRATMLTGLHTYTSGMYSNYQDWRKVPRLTEVPTMGQYFKQNGYYTAGAGKIFHYGQVDTLGWDDYYPSIKNPMPPDIIPENAPVGMKPFKYMYNMFDWSGLDIPDEETGDFKSVDYISQLLNKAHDKPFFLACGIYRPHLPWYVPKAYFDLFPIEEIQLPKLIEGDTADLGPRAREIITRGGNYHKHVVESNNWKNAVQGYLASTAYADAMVGNLLDALANSEYADNTIVVIWSDHGWQLGEKMHWRKFSLWENVIKTVLMIKVPEGLKSLPNGSSNGQVTQNLTSLLDVYPTLIELTGLPKRTDLDGKSLVPILRSPEVSIDRPIVTTYDYGDYSIRYQNWHYIQYIDQSEELYDLNTDKEEWYNLISDNRYDSIKEALKGFIPQNAVALPEASLLPLMEHHVPPIISREYYFSEDRKEWLKRFESND